MEDYYFEFYCDDYRSQLGLLSEERYAPQFQPYDPYARLGMAAKYDDDYYHGEENQEEEVDDFLF